MVDKVNPVSQFHPYSPADATPHSELPEPGGIKRMLGRVGIDSDNLGAFGDKLKSVDVRGSMSKVRDIARSKPALALGGLAVVAIGAGLLRGRSKT